MLGTLKKGKLGLREKLGNIYYFYETGNKNNYEKHIYLQEKTMKFYKKLTKNQKYKLDENVYICYNLEIERKRCNG